MLNFVDTNPAFEQSLQAIAVKHDLGSILTAIINNHQKSVTVLNDDLVVIVERGGGLAEVRIENDNHTLAKTKVGYWECNCEFLSIAYGMLDSCSLTAEVLAEAQETLNMLMSDCDECSYDECE